MANTLWDIAETCWKIYGLFTYKILATVPISMTAWYNIYLFIQTILIDGIFQKVQNLDAFWNALIHFEIYLLFKNLFKKLRYPQRSEDTSGSKMITTAHCNNKKVIEEILVWRLMVYPVFKSILEVFMWKPKRLFKKKL